MLGKTVTEGVTVAQKSKVVISESYPVTAKDVNNKTEILNTVTTKYNGEKGPGDDVTTPVEVEKSYDVEKTATLNKGTGNTATGAEVGDTILYVVTLTNTGNTDLTGIEVKDDMLGITVTEGVTVAQKSKVVISESYPVTEKDVNNKTEILNTVTTKYNGEKGPGDSVSTPVEAVPSIEVIKKVVSVDGVPVPDNTTATVVADNVIAYEITVTNNGNVTLNNVNVTDVMKISDLNGTELNVNGKLYSNAECTTPIKNGNMGTINTLAVGASQAYTVYYKVVANDVKDATKSITNIATATGVYTDPNNNKTTVEDDDNANVDITDSRDLSINKTQSVKQGEFVKPNDVITYTIKVKNNGNTPENNVIVTDTMNGNRNATITSIKNKNGEEIKDTENCTVSGNTITIPQLAIDEEITITATYTVFDADMAETTRNNIVNTATVKSDSLTTPKESSVETQTEIWNTNISVDKTSKLTKKSGNTITDKAEYGDTITYTIKATNKGNKPGTIDVTDSIYNLGVTLIKAQGTTNLTSDELAALETEAGLKKTLSVAGNSSTKIHFNVTVTAKPGQSIQNIATASDGTTPSDEGHNVEKKVSVKMQSQTPTITNSNVVIVLDISGSMADKPDGNPTDTKTETRLYAAQQASKALIDSMFKDNATGCQVSVVTFSSKSYGWSNYDNANPIGTATSSGTASDLKDKIDKLSAGGGTRIAAGLNEAKTQIGNLKDAKPNNNNIVIVLSDGDFTVNRNGEINNSGGETESRVKTASTNLKNSEAKPTVYAVAFASSNAGLMRDTIATQPSTNTFKTASNYDQLMAEFSKMGIEISDPDPVPVQSANGLVELKDLDPNQDITIRHRKAGATQFTTQTGKVSTFGNKIVLVNGVYKLDTTQFDADEEIQIDYVEIAKQQN